MNPNNFAILKICANYCCISSGLSRCETIDLLKDIALSKKSGLLINADKIYHI